MIEQVSPGIFLLPRVLTDEQIDNILNIGGLHCHHDEEGHAVNEDYYKKDEDEDEVKKPDRKKDKVDYPTENKQVLRYRADKPHRFPWIASLIWTHLPRLRIGNLNSCYVDENMQIYKLSAGGGKVPPHVDYDFAGIGLSVSLYSILIYLNRDYEGGETVFNKQKFVGDIEVGGGLLFRHNIPHEGLKVLSGEKYVLKTDIFFQH
jgi:hypothetical protein